MVCAWAAGLREDSRVGVCASRCRLQQGDEGALLLAVGTLEPEVWRALGSLMETDS